MRREICSAVRNLKSLPRALLGRDDKHTPHDGSNPCSRLAALALSLLLVGSLLGPLAFAGTASAVPAGMVSVPDGNVSEDFPVGEAQNASLRASDLEGSVMASDYGNSLEVIVTTRERASGYVDGGDSAALSGDGGLALVLRDDVHSQGRRVALDAGAVRTALGYTPKQVYGTHEDGSEWTSNVEYQAGMLVFEVPHFSSNTVTFSSTVSLTGTYTDESTVSYDVSSLDAVSDFSANLTGHTATETESVTGSGVYLDSSRSISVAGSTNPTGISTTQPQLTISAPEKAATPNGATLSADDQRHLFGYSGGYTYSGEVKFANPPPEISKLSMDFAFVGDSATVDVYISSGGPDSTHGEGTLVKSGWSPPASSGTTTMSLDSTYQTSNDPITVEFVTQSASGGTWQINVGPDSGSTQLVYTDGGGPNDGSTTQYAHIWTPGGASSVSASADDGTSVNIGSLAAGESTTVDFPVSTSATSLSLTGSGTVDYNLTYVEQTETIDPSISVNGHTASHSGTLADGSTTSLAVNKSWIEQGTNTVTVSVGDGTLSADAPAPTVGLDYSHDAQDKQTVNYTAEKWSEHYNVSKTFASDRSSASLTIPFDGHVSRIESLEMRTNGGTWTSVSDYSLDGTTLTVQLGSVSGGDSVAVRTTGRKVLAVNGSITVLEPTTMGERLDTKIKVDSWSDGAHLSLGGTPDGGRINYLYKESWSADEYATITADGYHYLYAPAASAGVTARVSTIPVRVNPTSGEVRVDVDDPLRDEPKFNVAPGASSGDAVEYTFIEATDGQKYALKSLDRETTVAQGTANSPLTLEDDDSEETLQFVVDDSGSMLDSGSGGGSFWNQDSGPVIPAMPVLNPGLVVVIVLGIIAAAIGYQQRRIRRPDVPDRAVYKSPLVLLAIVVAFGIGILLISPETVTTWLTLVLAQPLSNALNAALPLAGVLGVMAAIGMVVYWWWSRRQAKTADASTPDTVLRINAKQGDDK